MTTDRPYSSRCRRFALLWLTFSTATLAWSDDAVSDSGQSTARKSSHWAYRPIVRPPVPVVQNPDWARTPLDYFVLARLDAEGMEPSPEAERRVLIRRLYYDLLGLPPDPETVDAFAADPAPNAYQRSVDRLLSSPRFGERWGRHWLDMARYADSDGYEKDNPRPHAWRYRDWVIATFNADKPFDRFTVEQLAGDLLPEAGLSEFLATAFHRQTLTNTEGGTDQEEFRVEAIVDRIHTTSTVWLGLTMACAQCHDHKYDKISQEEFYRFFAFFDNADETTKDFPASDLDVAQYRKEKRAFDDELKRRIDKLAAETQALRESLPALEEDLRRRRRGKIRFRTLSADRILADDDGVSFERLDDGSHLAREANPQKAIYTFEASIGSPSTLDPSKPPPKSSIGGFRLDVLPHETLPNNGPGRSPNGNFVLSEFAVSVAPTSEFDSDSTKDLKFVKSRADVFQPGYPAVKAIDTIFDTGWAIDGHIGAPHHLDVALERPLPLDAGGERFLRIVLRQSGGGQHTLGRFRISAILGDASVVFLDDELTKILATDPKERSADQTATLVSYLASFQPSTRALAKSVDEHRSREPKLQPVGIRVLTERTASRRTTKVLHRGDFLQPRQAVGPGVPAVAGIEPKESSANRLDLARWLTSPANPLMPRVTVNYLWQHLFGRAFVTTVNDFGVRGEKPSHPALLDWLATEYRRLDWQRKAMLRTILLSATYRQSSHHRRELADVDPENRLLYRQNRFRVEAEIVRDLALATSGLLVGRTGGPSVFPPMPPEIAALSYGNSFRWTPSEGADRYRRGVYTFFKRTAPHPNLTTFDCPDANTTCVARRTSNTPLQALTTLNNEVFTECAQAFARRVLTTPTAATDSERLDHAFRLCIGRSASTLEESAFLELLEESRIWYDQNLGDAEKMVGSYGSREVPSPSEAAWVGVTRILLNLDEFLTRE